MTTAPLADRQRTALAQLTDLVRTRAHAEAAAEEAFAAASADADREVQRARRQVGAGRKKAADDLAAGHAAAAAATADRYAAAESDAADARQSLRTRTVNHYSAQLQKLRSEAEEKAWTIDSLREAAEKEAEDRHAELTRKAALAGKHLEGRWDAVGPKLARVRLDREGVAFDAARLPTPTPTDPVGKVDKCLEDVDAAADRLLRTKVDTLLGVGPTLVVAVVLAGVGAGFGFGFMPWPANLAVTLGSALGGGLIARGLVVFVARRQIKDRGTALGVYYAEAVRAVAALRKYADATHAAARQAAADRAATSHAQATGFYTPKIKTAETQLATKLADIDAAATRNRADLAAGRTAEEQAEVARHAAAQATATEQADRDLAAAEARFEARTAAANSARAEAWAELAACWHAGIREARTEFAEQTAAGEMHFAPWADLPGRPLADAVPAGVRFGTLAVDLEAMPDGSPADPRVRLGEPLAVTLPAFAPFPERAAVLVKAADTDRPRAVGVLQSLMLRFLTSLPPGKVRFTILDPVGLGENFAAFMHLADFDEKLVASRIWTEPAHIEARLTDLTEHMETVIQKYLRNQYKSIEEYNRAAGEVAEPYRVLVVANFPTNFSADAARRLVSIMASGPACGVCTLVSVDTKSPLPRDFRLADLEQVAYTLALQDGRATPVDPALAPFPVTLDPPPPPTAIAQAVRRVGQASLDAARVEVPFEYITPAADKVWMSSAAKGFDVPIGRAGATRRQAFTVGRGTAQHALVAGKTGSGKSTLLHALITNLALHYSPDEAELYLIDFKKGVEFQAYADAKLPHARVIAVESEREFGLSVLQRLDGVLRERGDQFRDAGVNDLAGYREHLLAHGGGRCPRVLFVVDEFQEFFVEDDKIAQEAALLLDRLVRQGRAFGVHVLLGSQTLGGAYSIPRATVDQMAVRIALQCSEADAQLILSKDNTAARLLNRPGEAIYNDANGLVEGNNPFQVVWLDDERRSEVLASIRARAVGRTDPPPLVFAGNAAVDMATSPGLVAADGRTPPAIYLGDPVAITAPTAAVFRPQSGANLLLLGQQEDAALAVLTSALVGLTRRGVPVTVFDGTPDDADTAGYLQAAADIVGPSAVFVDRDGMTTALGDLAAELDRRQAGGADRSPRFLLVHGLHRLRALRKPEDDFGYGRKGDKPAAPGELFAGLVREGPAVGLHVVAWCDSLTNLQRAVDRAGLRDFALRVLFQMSPTDSSQLIDTPAASKLGRNRGLFLEDGAERPEKFRPYALPGLAWLRRLGRADPVPADKPAAVPG